MRRKRPHGFTIVELLIVIVVIAILAAITIVAYNGIQTRAKNVKTTNAAVAWVKILKLYNAEKGSWPSENSCLGSPSTYPDNGQCWDNAYWVVRSPFVMQIQQYVVGSTYPEPDTTDIASGTGNTPRRGLLYSTDNATYWILYVFQIGTGSCPSVGLPVRSGPSSHSVGFYCQYNLI